MDQTLPATLLLCALPDSRPRAASGDIVSQSDRFRTLAFLSSNPGEKMPPCTGRVRAFVFAARSLSCDSQTATQRTGTIAS